MGPVLHGASVTWGQCYMGPVSIGLVHETSVPRGSVTWGQCL